MQNRPDLSWIGKLCTNIRQSLASAKQDEAEGDVVSSVLRSESFDGGGDHSFFVLSEAIRAVEKANQTAFAPRHEENVNMPTMAWDADSDSECYVDVPEFNSEHEEHSVREFDTPIYNTAANAANTLENAGTDDSNFSAQNDAFAPSPELRTIRRTASEKVLDLDSLARQSAYERLQSMIDQTEIDHAKRSNASSTGSENESGVDTETAEDPEIEELFSTDDDGIDIVEPSIYGDADDSAHINADEGSDVDVASYDELSDPSAYSDPGSDAESGLFQDTVVSKLEMRDTLPKPLCSISEQHVNNKLYESWDDIDSLTQAALACQVATSNAKTENTADREIIELLSESEDTMQTGEEESLVENSPEHGSPREVEKPRESEQLDLVTEGSEDDGNASSASDSRSRSSDVEMIGNDVEQSRPECAQSDFELVSRRSPASASPVTANPPSDFEAGEHCNSAEPLVHSVRAPGEFTTPELAVQPTVQPTIQISATPAVPSAVAQIPPLSAVTFNVTLGSPVPPDDAPCSPEEASEPLPEQKSPVEDQSIEPEPTSPKRDSSSADPDSIYDGLWNLFNVGFTVAPDEGAYIPGRTQTLQPAEKPDKDVENADSIVLAANRFLDRAPLFGGRPAPPLPVISYPVPQGDDSGVEKALELMAQAPLFGGQCVKRKASTLKQPTKRTRGRSKGRSRR